MITKYTWLGTSMKMQGSNREPNFSHLDCMCGWRREVRWCMAIFCLSLATHSSCKLLHVVSGDRPPLFPLGNPHGVPTRGVGRPRASLSALLRSTVRVGQAFINDVCSSESSKLLFLFLHNVFQAL